MFAGGIVTVFVTDLDRSVKFYSEDLGLRLLQHWPTFAMIDAGHGLTIGLHPTTHPIPPAGPASMSIGLQLTGGISEAIRTLEQRGVKFTSGIINDGGAGNFAHLTDPDGNPLYIREAAQSWQRSEAASKELETV